MESIPTLKRHQKELFIFGGLLLLGALLAYIDNMLHMQTILIETVHALVVTTILIFCLVCQQRYPEIKQYGWDMIIWGLVLMMIGSWVDILDDPPLISLIQIGHIPFGRSWEQAFIKKILGYAGGISLIAYGFFQWVPWMIETKLKVEKLNQRLGAANKEMKTVLISLEEHIESERLVISRELHDDVAQRLTFLNLQLQMCQRELPHESEKTLAHLKNMGQELGETLKVVRHISSNLRPEALYSLGLVPAIEQFLEKLRPQAPDTEIKVLESYLNLDEGHTRIETQLNERDLLHMFRILQEGVRNAIKHAKAAHIEIWITEHPDYFQFLVEDDGIGLPWQHMPSEDSLVQEGHLGIAGMKERVLELAGTFALRARMPQGTCMEIVIQK